MLFELRGSLSVAVSRIFSPTRFPYFQYEAKMKTLETDMKEMESKKRILEEAVDSLNEEIAKLKAKGIIRCRGYCTHFEIAGDLFGFVLQPCNLFSNLLCLELRHF